MKKWFGIALIVAGSALLILHHPAAPPPLPDDGIRVSSGTIGTGGSLSNSLRQAGLSAQAVHDISRAMRPEFNPKYARADHVYEIIRSTAGNLVSFRYWPSPLENVVVEPRTDGGWTASSHKLPLEETVLGARGEIHTSLWESMRSQGIPPDVIYQFSDIFRWRIDFLTEPRQGDTYRLAWVRRSANGSYSDDEILCAHYRQTRKDDHFAFRVENEYYDAEGKTLHGRFLRAPLNFRRISSYFTNRRYHPVLRFYRPHHGIDYAAARGTPVVSIGHGVVTKIGWDGGLGKSIRIRHEGGYESIYGHLAGYARGLGTGSRVSQGQFIGRVGSTGLATGPHLHFGFKKEGRLVNFFAMKFRGSRKTIPADKKEEFAEIKRKGYTYLGRLVQGQGAPQPL